MNHLSLKTCLRPSAQSHGELWEEEAREAGTVALITVTSFQGRPMPLPTVCHVSLEPVCGVVAHGVPRQSGPVCGVGLLCHWLGLGFYSALRLHRWSSWRDCWLTRMGSSRFTATRRCFLLALRHINNHINSYCTLYPDHQQSHLMYQQANKLH